MAKTLAALVSMMRGSGIKKDYTIDVKDELGNGRYGMVMRAIDNKTKQAVAVKKMSKRGADAATLQRMKREVEVMRMVKHKNCIQFLNVYESRNVCYIVMELVTGGDLLDRVIEKDHYTEFEAANCFKQITGYLHSLGIVHRDLKPENILYANRRPDAAIKIVDYGLAREQPDRRSRLYSRCGSPSFVAPEVLNGTGYYSACDVWSIRCILYILLCGFLPFDVDEVDLATLSIPKAVTCAVDFPKPHWDMISPDAVELVQKMLSLNPDHRPSCVSILNHKWLLKRNEGALPRKDLTDIQSRLKQMRMNTVMGAIHSLTALNKMRSQLDWEALHKILVLEAEHRLNALKMDPTKMSALKESFKMLDRDHSGRISLQNLKDTLHAVGRYKDEEDLVDMMSKFDLYKTGDITFEEYCIMMSPTPAQIEREMLNVQASPSLVRTKVSETRTDSADGAFPTYEEELHAAFADLDTDSSGHIDPRNLKVVMSHFGMAVTDDEAREMIQLADIRGDGVIHKDEFIEFIARHMLTPGPSLDFSPQEPSPMSSPPVRVPSASPPSPLVPSNEYHNLPACDGTPRMSGASRTSLHGSESTSAAKLAARSLSARSRSLKDEASKALHFLKGTGDSDSDADDT